MSHQPPPPPPPSPDQWPQAGQGPAAATPALANPWWKRWWVVTLGVIGVLVVIGIFTGSPEETDPDLAADDNVPEEPAELGEDSDAIRVEEPAPASEPEPETPEESESQPAVEEPESAPAEPEADPEPQGFGNGTYVVGEDLEPGTYRSSGTSLCYWARLSSFGGQLDDIIANGNNTPEIVTIDASDQGFETSGCGAWMAVEDTAPDSPATSFDDGTFQIGVHIEPGTYRADGDPDELCYWARLSSFSQAGIDGIITNGNNPTVIEIAASDAGFTSFGCGTWTR